MSLDNHTEPTKDSTQKDTLNISTLKRQIDEILAGFYNSACEPRNINPAYPPIPHHEATQQILALLKDTMNEVMPEPPDIDPGFALDGYNQAIDDMKANLERLIGR